MQTSNTLGKWGEDQAVRFLIGKGYRVISRNFRSRFGEIDIIAENDTALIFVEVKLRHNNAHGQPEEYVDFRKQRKLQITAEYYLLLNPSTKQPRFDVISLYAPNGTQTYPIPIKHIKNAF